MNAGPQFHIDRISYLIPCLPCAAACFCKSSSLLHLGQACHQHAIIFVVGRLLFHLFPFGDGVLFVPWPPGLRIEGSLLGEALQRVVILLEIENPVTLAEIKIAAVELFAMW
ncbi:MAG: hypothetical protein WB495_18815 [Xanthobacteraceae bacterium]